MQKQFHFILVLIFLSLTTSFIQAESIRSTKLMLGKVIKEEKAMGVYALPKNKEILVEMTINGMGGFKELKLIKTKDATVLAELNDVTGFGLLDKRTLIVTTSPIYGKPGLYALDTVTGKVKTLMEAKNKTAGYPEGADYFELQKIDNQQKMINYYYAPDVDAVDFTIFREPRNILKCPIYGPSEINFVCTPPVI